VERGGSDGHHGLEAEVRVHDAQLGDQQLWRQEDSHTNIHLSFLNFFCQKFQQ